MKSSFTNIERGQECGVLKSFIIFMKMKRDERDWISKENHIRKKKRKWEI